MILGALPFALVLLHASLSWTGILAVLIAMIMASAFSAILATRRTLDKPRFVVCGYFLPVKNSLIFWPLNLAPSTTVWPIPANISLNPRPT
jgi:hypothetical protein